MAMLLDVTFVFCFFNVIFFLLFLNCGCKKLHQIDVQLRNGAKQHCRTDTEAFLYLEQTSTSSAQHLPQPGIGMPGMQQTVAGTGMTGHQLTKGGYPQDGTVKSVSVCISVAKPAALKFLLVLSIDICGKSIEAVQAAQILCHIIPTS